MPIIIASAVSCALVAAVAMLVFRGLGVPYAPFFAVLLLAAGPGMPERLTRLRSENEAFMLLGIAIFCLARRRHIALAIVSFLFMASYHGAILLIPVALIFALAAIERERLPSLAGIGAVLGGIAAGLIISPWWPENIGYLFFHTLFKLSSENSHLTGTEWGKPSWWQILRTSWVIHLLLAVAMATFLFRRFRDRGKVRLSTESKALLMLVLLSLWMYHDALRNASYYTLFAIFAAALLWRDAAIEMPRPAAAVFAFACSALAVAACWTGTRQLMQLNATAPPVMSHYREIGLHLKQHTSPGDIVFNIAWSDFPLLLWQNDQLRYVSGLDGNYLAYGDPERFKVWYALLLGKPLDGSPSLLLQNTFDTEWVVVPRSESMDAIAMRIIDGGDAETVLLNGEGWLIHLTPTVAANP